MCLSDVYQLTSSGQQEPIATKVSSITSDQGSIKIVDIFGDEVTLSGVIENVDLLENKILIRPEN